MAEKSLSLYSYEVKTALANSKVLLLRPVMPQPTGDLWPDADSCIEWSDVVDNPRYYTDCGWCKFARVGNTLWVRENGWERPDRTTRMLREGADTWPPYQYDADDCDHKQLRAWGWVRKPAIRMRYTASRLDIRITDIGVERLHRIGEVRAKATGVTSKPVVSVVRVENYLSYCEALADAWNAGPGKRYPFVKNPWCWLIWAEVIRREDRESRG